MNFKKLSAVCLSAMFVAPFSSAGMNENSEFVEPCSSVEKKENSESNKNAELCVICQENLKNIENLSPGTFYSNREEYKAACGHVMHGNCLLQWLRYDNNNKWMQARLPHNFTLQDLRNFNVEETCCPLCRQPLGTDIDDLKMLLSRYYEVVDVTEYYGTNNPDAIAEKIFQQFGKSYLNPTGRWYKQVSCHMVETDIGPRYLVVKDSNLSSAIENKLHDLWNEDFIRRMNNKTCCEKIVNCVDKMFWPTVIGGVVCWVTYRLLNS